MHESLANGRWQQFSLAEQLGNIGSEISRANHWQEQKKQDHAQLALERALELFDLTLADQRWSGRRRELCRAREVVCDFFAGDNTYHSTAMNLQKYFDAFAWQAQLLRQNRNQA